MPSQALTAPQSLLVGRLAIRQRLWTWFVANNEYANDTNGSPFHQMPVSLAAGTSRRHASLTGLDHPGVVGGFPPDLRVH